MGRSVSFRKVADADIERLLAINKVSSKKLNDEMPNFTRKKTIHEHRSNRSLKV